MMNLLSFKFWFDLRPVQMLPIFQNTFTAVIFLFIAGFFIFWILKRRKKGLFSPIFEQLYVFSLTNAFIGMVLWFFNYEYVPFLSARFWFMIWGVSIAVWLAFIANKMRQIPERRRKIEEEKEFNKYIP